MPAQFWSLKVITTLNLSNCKLKCFIEDCIYSLLLSYVLRAVDEIISVENLLHGQSILIKLHATRMFLRGLILCEWVRLCNYWSLPFLVDFFEVLKVLSMSWWSYLGHLRLTILLNHISTGLYFSSNTNKY